MTTACNQKKGHAADIRIALLAASRRAGSTSIELQVIRDQNQESLILLLGLALHSRLHLGSLLLGQQAQELFASFLKDLTSSGFIRVGPLSWSGTVMSNNQFFDIPLLRPFQLSAHSPQISLPNWIAPGLNVRQE